MDCARSLVRVDALFYAKAAAEAGLFREDVRDPKRAFCGGGGGELVSSPHVVTPDAVVGEEEEGDLEVKRRIQREFKRCGVVGRVSKSRISVLLVELSYGNAVQRLV